MNPLTADDRDLLTSGRRAPMERHAFGNGVAMNADEAQQMFEQACKRLFALHADGYKRPRQSRKSAAARPAVATRVRPAARPRAHHII